MPRVAMLTWFVLGWIALSGPGCAAGTSEATPAEEATPPTTSEIWEELCAASTIDESCSGNYCRNEAVIPIEAYCEHFECPQDLADYEERFSTCDSPTEEWPRCGWEREVGCGVVQYTEPHDESSFHTIAFDAVDGSMLSFMYSSDVPLGKCDAADFRVGTFSDYFHRRDPPCADIQTDTCCHRDAPHLW